MDLPFNAEIRCEDGMCGRSSHIVYDPDAHEITHLVVKDGLLGEERLLPVQLVRDSTDTAIRLGCTKAEVRVLPLFVRNEYIGPNKFSDKPVGHDFLLIPRPSFQQGWVAIKKKQPPEGELALIRGLPVQALDGPLGHVHEFQIDPASRKITHLVIDDGQFWDMQHFVVPVSAIDHLGKDLVCLRITRYAVEALSALTIV